MLGGGVILKIFYFDLRWCHAMRRCGREKNDVSVAIIAMRCGVCAASDFGFAGRNSS